ncbi:hypothetical protein F5Y18DRAFT_394576 [Xylariaceae sp. FL1019]|nr:hypothetical protein F5Y18DRAFT_394576 [Xylariaceae sp. FL1019]
MHHLTLLLTLLSSLLLIPLSLAQDQCLGNKADAGYCTPLTYVDTTLSAKSAPTTTDCEDTCHGVNSDAGDWLVDFGYEGNGGLHPMLAWPCAFALQPGNSSFNNASFDMANQDILDLYDESINRFGPLHDGKISAEGTMMCQGVLARWFIKSQ